MSAIEPFVHRVRVRYAEIDAQNVVFNAHWLTFFDETCTRFMEALGWGKEAWFHEFDLMLVRAVVEWQGPARFDDWIDIAVAPTRLGSKSFDFGYTATVEERPACSAVITYVSVIPGKNHSTAIPDAVRAAFTARLVEPEG